MEDRLQVLCLPIYFLTFRIYLDKEMLWENRRTLH